MHYISSGLTQCGMTRIGSYLYEHPAIFQFQIFKFTPRERINENRFREYGTHFMIW